jgi:hypothetical protein
MQLMTSHMPLARLRTGPVDRQDDVGGCWLERCSVLAAAGWHAVSGAAEVGMQPKRSGVARAARGWH